MSHFATLSQLTRHRLLGCFSICQCHISHYNLKKTYLTIWRNIPAGQRPLPPVKNWVMLGDVVICHRKLLFIIACLSLQSIEKNVHICKFCSCCWNSWFWIMTKGCFWIHLTGWHHIMAASSSGLYEDGNALKMSYSPAAMCSRILWMPIPIKIGMVLLPAVPPNNLTNRDLGHHAGPPRRNSDLPTDAGHLVLRISADIEPHLDIWWNLHISKWTPL